MANIVVNTADFKGGYFNYASSTERDALLQAAITRYETKYIMLVLSNEALSFPKGLGQLFIDECNANVGNFKPTSARMLAFFNAFDKTWGIKMHHSDGFADMLRKFIFYHFVTDNSIEDTLAGVASSNEGAANKASYRNSYRFAERIFNSGLETYHSIRWWIQTGDNTGGGISVYPEYVNSWPMKAKYASII